MKANIDEEKANIASIVYFKLTSPLLSIAMIDAKRCKLKNESLAKENSESDEELGSENDDVTEGGHKLIFAKRSFLSKTFSFLMCIK